jgi:hypothetical protein
LEEAEETQDPDDARREQKIETAQNLREQGFTCQQAGDAVGMSKGWVSENTSIDN